MTGKMRRVGRLTLIAAEDRHSRVRAGAMDDKITHSLMKIYFAGSIRGGREDVDLYLQIIEYLKKYGQVLTEHVGDKTLSAQGEDGPTAAFIHERDMSWLLASDAIVAEVTTPSLGVGYEISQAVENNKKVLCLFRPQSGRKLSAMIAGAPQIINREYSTIEEAKQAIDKFLSN